MLDLLGETWEPLRIDFFGGQTRSAQYRESVSELGEAPVLDDASCTRWQRPRRILR